MCVYIYLCMCIPYARVTRGTASAETSPGPCCLSWDGRCSPRSWHAAHEQTERVSLRSYPRASRHPHPSRCAPSLSGAALLPPAHTPVRVQQRQEPRLCGWGKEIVWFLNWDYTWSQPSRKNSQAKNHRNWARCWAAPIENRRLVYKYWLSVAVVPRSYAASICVLKTVRTRHLKIRILCQTVNTHKHAAFH